MIIRTRITRDELSNVVEINEYKSSTIVTSSWIETENRLLVTFNSGTTYQYEGVDTETYQAFAEAESQGSTLNKLIKGKFESKKLEGNEEAAN